MKNKIKVLFIIFIILELLFGSIKVLAVTAIVNENDVAFRRNAEADSEIMDLLKKGTELEIIEQDGEWYKVKYIDENNSRYTGYIKAEKLDVDEIAQEDEEEKNVKQDDINQNNIDNTKKIEENTNIKIENAIDVKILPLIYSSKIGTIEKNTEVLVSEIVGGWCKIESDTLSGWVIL